MLGILSEIPCCKLKMYFIHPSCILNTVVRFYKFFSIQAFPIISLGFKLDIIFPTLLQGFELKTMNHLFCNQSSTLNSPLRFIFHSQ